MTGSYEDLTVRGRHRINLPNVMQIGTAKYIKIVHACAITNGQIGNMLKVG